MNQSSLKPTNKVTAVGVSGALTVVVVYVLGLYGVNLPAEVASALTILISFAGGYLVKE